MQDTSVNEYTIMLKRIITHIESLPNIQFNTNECYKMTIAIQHAACCIAPEVSYIIAKLMTDVNDITLIDPDSYEDLFKNISDILQTKISDDIFYMNNSMYKQLLTFVNAEIIKHNARIHLYHLVMIDFPNDKLFVDMLKVLCVMNIRRDWKEIHAYLIEKVHPTAIMELQRVHGIKTPRKDPLKKNASSFKPNEQISITTSISNNLKDSLKLNLPKE